MSDPRPDADPAPVMGRAAWARVLLAAAIGPVVAGYLAIAALLALVVALAPGATFGTLGVLAAAGPAWLAGWHVPLNISGHELGVLPLLPTIVLVAVVARASATAAHRLDATTPAGAVPILATVGGTHACVATALAVAGDGDALDVSPPLAFFVCGALATVAAMIGVARPCGVMDAALAHVDTITFQGLRAAVRGLCGLAAVTTLTLAGAMIATWSTSAGLFRNGAPGFGAGLGMALLCLAYLPNVLVGVLSFLAGPGFSIGDTTVGPFAFQPGPMPGIPVLAAVPVTAAHWWPLLVLLPAAVGGGVGWWCRTVSDQPLRRVRAVLVAALVAGVGCLALAALAGGALAGGPFDPVTVPAGLLAVAVFGWIAVPGSLVTWLAGIPANEPNEPEPEPENAEEAETGEEEAAEEEAVVAADGD